MMRLPLLLTASVSTRGMVGADFNASEREQMYLETLRFYGREILSADAEQPLVFAENSGWDLKAMAAKLPPELARRIEWIAVDPSRCDISRGKGYNEILLIDSAVRQSSAIAAAGAFLKVTGRYPVFNLRYFLRSARDFLAAGGAFYGDMKDHRVFDWLRTGWNGHAAYTVLFGTTVDFWRRRLADSYQACNDYTDDLIENVWYRLLVGYRHKQSSDRVSLRFRREPVCGGVQGSNLAAITFAKSNRSLKSRCIRFVGNAIRLLTPWFWF